VEYGTWAVRRESACVVFAMYKLADLFCCPLTSHSLYFFNHAGIRMYHPCLELHMLLQLPQTPSYTQSKCFRVIGNHPRPTPISNLHNTLNIEPIPVIIHRLTDKFFAHCPSHHNPLVQQIGNYTLVDLTNLYKKYEHKRTKHILL
jgi:uncharacterized protein YbaR (Trm112 family)